MGNLFSILQRVGKSFMLPIAILPIAGLFLGISSSAANFAPLPEPVNNLMTIMSSVSGSIFSNLPIIFALGVALGMAKKEKGVATLSAGIAYFVMNAAISAMLTLNGQLLPDGSIAKDVLPGMIVNNCGINTLQMGVFGGIVVGLGVAYLHNRFYMLELPDMISFFGGTRFVPIISTVVYMFVGILMYFLWPPVQMGIAASGELIAGSGYLGTLLFGIIQRALIPLGLHHVFYMPFWFTALGGTMEVAGKVVEGGQNIFFAQLANAKDIAHFSADATRYFSGEFIFMIFGLPGAALAMYRTAKPEKKKAVGGLLISASLTSILTGITEPIEFSFTFVAPILFLVQVILAGSAYMVAQMLNIAVGLTFSGGILDLFFFGVLQGNEKTSWLLIIPAGIVYFALYYFIFYYLILKLNLPTPGREEGEETRLYGKADVQKKYGVVQEQNQYADIVKALGGKANIDSMDCCATRLRMSVKDAGLLDEATLKANGALAVIRDGTALQLVFGPKVSLVKNKIEEYLEHTGSDSQAAEVTSVATKEAAAMPLAEKPKLEQVKYTVAVPQEASSMTLKGKSIVAGIALAKLKVLGQRPLIKRIEVEQTAQEIERLEAALLAVKSDLAQDIKSADAQFCSVLGAQLIMLDDASFTDCVKKYILEYKVCAEYAVQQTGKSLAEEFRGMDNAYMQARSEDMEQIAQRVADKLIGYQEELQLQEESIVMAESFTPAQLAAWDKRYLKGLVAHKGNASSHTAILAANYGLPYICDLEVMPDFDGAEAVLDAENACLVINPDAQSKAWAQSKIESLATATATSGGTTKMKVYANIGSVEEVEQALAMQADGIGLFRTEFLFMNRSSAPSQEEQYQVYKRVLEAMGEKPVIIRTIDIGTDKQAAYLQLPKEENPALGLRGVRVSLADTAMFREQLKALLRASCYGNAQIMFPMITSVKEIMAIKEQLRLAEAELQEAKLAYKMPKLGIMVETPAAALSSEELAQHVDFFSLGTNDLTQYTLALDRQAEGMDAYYEPHHVAVFRLIEATIEGGHKRGIPVGICGQLGGDVTVIPRLVEAGLDEVSVAIASIPRVRRAILSAEDAPAVSPDTVPDHIEHFQISAPVAGELVPMEAIPDPTFAQGILGQGFGVLPSCGQICAPISGIISSVAPTCHAVTLRDANGQEVLVHIGIDTVELAGKGFNVQVKPGQRVQTGDLLVAVDLAFLAQKGYNPMVITVMLDSAVQSEPVVADAFAGKCFIHTIKDPLGIHARPAGELVSLLKDLDCTVRVSCGTQSADGRSVIQLMKLGAGKGSELKIAAEGKDAAKALKQWQAYLHTHL